jgi:hypothetical protein
LDLVFEVTRNRVAEWSARPDVLAVLLVGSRSRGHSDDLSDDDLEVILTDESASQIAPGECSDVYIEGEGVTRRIIYDAEYLGLSGLRAKLQSPFDLDHWPYERAHILFHRVGEVAKIVEGLGKMDADFRAKRLKHSTIDAWIPPYRAKKCIKRGQMASARLLVSRGARALSRLAFALESRWVPLDHWLEPELKTLKDPAGLGHFIVQALLTGDPIYLENGLAALDSALLAEGIPGPKGRGDLFLELIHPENAVERAIHGLT